MKDSNNSFDRLLRLAAQVTEDFPAVPPLGFETRVLAHWRSDLNPVHGLSRLLRRVAFLAVAVMLVSTAAAVRELQQASEVGDSVTNEFAIADSAIQNEFSR